jgi:hypothetical protein
MKEIDKAFSTTAVVLFGKPFSGIEQYKAWLTARVKQAIVKKVPSKLTGKDVMVGQVAFFEQMGSNIVTLDESLPLGEKSLTEAEVSSLCMANAGKLLSKISTTTPEIVYGTNIDTDGCACFGPTQHCQDTTFCWFSKKVACSFWTRDSDSVFGCSNLVLSSFCMRCHSSTTLTRCFEVNDSSRCSDSYFCHNCEGLQDSMFCFNAKNKRYAIGNVEVGREAYLKVKALLCSQMHAELEATHALSHDIFSIGSGMKEKKKRQRN